MEYANKVAKIYLSGGVNLAFEMLITQENGEMIGGFLLNGKEKRTGGEDQSNSLYFRWVPKRQILHINIEIDANNKGDFPRECLPLLKYQEQRQAAKKVKKAATEESTQTLMKADARQKIPVERRFFYRSA